MGVDSALELLPGPLARNPRTRQVLTEMDEDDEEFDSPQHFVDTVARAVAPAPPVAAHAVAAHAAAAPAAGAGAGRPSFSVTSFNVLPTAGPAGNKALDGSEAMNTPVQLKTGALTIQAAVNVQLPHGHPRIEVGFIQTIELVNIEMKWSDGSLVKQFSEAAPANHLLDVHLSSSGSDFPWYHKGALRMDGGPIAWTAVAASGTCHVEFFDQPGFGVRVASRAAHLGDARLNHVSLDRADGVRAPANKFLANARYRFTNWLAARLGGRIMPLASVRWVASVSADATITVQDLGFFQSTTANVLITSPAPQILAVDTALAIPAQPLAAVRSGLETLFNLNPTRLADEAKARAAAEADAAAYAAVAEFDPLSH